MSELTHKDLLGVLHAYFLDKDDLTRHQIEPYNNFIINELPQILRDEPPWVVENKGDTYTYTFGEPFLDDPQITEEDRSTHLLYPMECMQRDMTYEANLYVDINEIMISAETRKAEQQQQLLATLQNEGHKGEEDEEREVEIQNLQESITQLIEIGKTRDTRKLYQKRLLCTLPIMVGCYKCNTVNLSPHEKVRRGECPLTPGGWFLTKGTQRVIVGQERANYNQPYAFTVTQNKTKIREYQIEMRSTQEMGIKPQLFQISTHRNQLRVSSGWISELPIGILLIALDDPFSFRKRMLEESQVEEQYLLPYIEAVESSTIIHEKNKDDEPSRQRNMTQKEARDHIKSKNLSSSQNNLDAIFSEDLIPHMGSDNTGKIRYIYFMVERLLQTAHSRKEGKKRRAEDDRDDFGNKRVDWAGVLVRYLFRLFLKKWIQKFQTQMSKQGNAKTAFEKNDTITKGIKGCMNTGNWGVQNTRTGVSQVATNLDGMAFLSHLRRFCTPAVREGKMQKIRYLHPSQYNLACAAESPDGPGIGVVKNLALMTFVSIQTSDALLLKFFDNIEPKWKFIKLQNLKKIGFNFPKVFINGEWIGVIKSQALSAKLANHLREARLMGHIHRETGIVWDPIDLELRLNCDSGRLMRPVFWLEGGIPTIERKHLNLSWDDLVYQGFICYIDASEAAFTEVACSLEDVYITNRKNKFHYQYAEIHPSTILGAACSIIPVPNHSQAPRNIFAGSMIKQGQAIVGLNTRLMFDTTSYELTYPQKQLCAPFSSKIVNHDANPTGFMAILAIAEAEGSNQEDSVKVKKSAIDRGMGRTIIYHSYTVVEKRRGTTHTETIEIPPKSVMSRTKNYNKLQQDGIVAKGERVFPGDVLVGKTISNGNTQTLIDASHVVKEGEEGVVEEIMTTINSERLRIVKIKVRDYHIPELGDKVDSICGQKATIGMIEAEENLPFTASGMTPDAILYPPAMPSRMTIDYMIEAICGKAALVSGDTSDKFTDLTPFRPDLNRKFIVEEVGKTLVQNGFQSNGNEMMYDGTTGLPFKAHIFMGPVFYQISKHMVGKKIHSRSSGRVGIMMRQPISGRSKGGGLRVGEMEKDCLVSQGCSALLRERLLEVSDRYECDVCVSCGVFCFGQCNACRTEVRRVVIPYAVKLLFQELMAFGIMPRVMVQ